ncbi:MAG: PDDEXK nuclease domain-containing protein [Firmicutes bacterium]|nr:PDDEXK nuclease domain-containing protein [Bacillota bacterium]
MDANPGAGGFFDRVASVIADARKFVGRTADLSMCVTYFEIGRMIVEKEQEGKARAEYGKELIAELSKYLTDKFNRGFSETNLRNARFFYNAYSERLQKETGAARSAIGQLSTERFAIQQMSSAEFNSTAVTPIQQLSTAEFRSHESIQQAAKFFTLGWTHYTVLMRIENADERRFYEIESERGGWTVEQLKRQYHSSLCERLALSRDKNEVMRLANEGQTVEKPRDMLKNPLVLEFLGMAERAAFSETELETAIITKLQDFLLELGKGFLFEARQKRFSFEEQSFFVDLVLYNRLLQCYVLIDLKTEELKHQDLGQMQMYVNYFDRYVKQDFEKPSVGILLCKKKADGIVKLTLPENSKIYASEYRLYLPDKTLLQAKLAEWIQEFEDGRGL